MGYYEDLPDIDINEELEYAARVPGAVIIDVRTPEEYREGHVPGALNIEDIKFARTNREYIESILQDKDARIFMYCYSGSRSGIAASFLRQMGYRVDNIGGYEGYTGPVETGDGTVI